MDGANLIIEVVLKTYKCHADHQTIQQSALHFLKSNPVPVYPGSVITSFSNDEILNDVVKCIIIEDVLNYQESIDFQRFKIKWLIYSVSNSLPMIQNEYSSDGEINLATHLVLPNADLVNSWENLHYDSDIKDNLLRYANTMMKFADSTIDRNVIACNKVILLHGPPGTGKTSLCKALAHKLAVRMQDRYPTGLFIEINSHSLFSRYFSESGKLVTQMFSSIKDVIENGKVLVCVLIDEVESLAHAREQCLSGVEPSDSIRAVNAVLTQIDQINRYPNVLILTTSNLTKSIDLAFIDRADVKQFLGLPRTPAIYKIFLSCIQELQRVDILDNSVQFLPIHTVLNMERENLDVQSGLLLDICNKSVGLSGRALRKIPFIAHALFFENQGYGIKNFLVAMEMAVIKEKSDRSKFN